MASDDEKDDDKKKKRRSKSKSDAEESGKSDADGTKKDKKSKKSKKEDSDKDKDKDKDKDDKEKDKDESSDKNLDADNQDKESATAKESTTLNDDGKKKKKKKSSSDKDDGGGGGDSSAASATSDKEAKGGDSGSGSNDDGTDSKSVKKKKSSSKSETGSKKSSKKDNDSATGLAADDVGGDGLNSDLGIKPSEGSHQLEGDGEEKAKEEENKEDGDGGGKDGGGSGSDKEKNSGSDKDGSDKEKDANGDDAAVKDSARSNDSGGGDKEKGSKPPSEKGSATAKEGTGSARPSQQGGGGSKPVSDSAAAAAAGQEVALDEDGNPIPQPDPVEQQLDENGNPIEPGPLDTIDGPQYQNDNVNVPTAVSAGEDDLALGAEADALNRPSGLIDSVGQTKLMDTQLGGTCESPSRLQARDRFGNPVDRKPSYERVPEFSPNSPLQHETALSKRSPRSHSPGRYNRDPTSGPVASYRSRAEDLKKRQLSPPPISNNQPGQPFPNTGPQQLNFQGQNNNNMMNQNISNSMNPNMNLNQNNNNNLMGSGITSSGIGSSLNNMYQGPGGPNGPLNSVSPGPMPQGHVFQNLNPTDGTITGNPDVEKFLEGFSREINIMQNQGNMNQQQQLQNQQLQQMQQQQQFRSPGQLSASQRDILEQQNQITQGLTSIPNSHSINQKHRQLTSAKQQDDFSNIDVAQPRTPLEMKYKQAPSKVYDVDYSPQKHVHAGPEHWQDRFNAYLRQNPPPDELLKGLPRGQMPPNQIPPQPQRSGSPSRDEYPGKYVLNPAFLSLGEFIDTTIKQFKQWVQLNGKTLTSGEEQIIESIVKGLSSKLTQIEFEPTNNRQDRPAPLPAPQPQIPAQLPPVVQNHQTNSDRKANNASNNKASNKALASSESVAQAIESKQILAPLLKPTKRMESKIYDRIRRGLTETFCYYARSDVNYDAYSPPKWISTRQWVMFLRGFEMSAITGIAFSDLVNVYGPKKEPIEFVDFMEMLSAIGRRTMELLHRKQFNELNMYNEEPKTYSLYRFTEVFGFHDAKNTFRQFLRGREKIRYKSRGPNGPGGSNNNNTNIPQRSPGHAAGGRNSPLNRDPNVFPPSLPPRPPQNLHETRLDRHRQMKQRQTNNPNQVPGGGYEGLRHPQQQLNVQQPHNNIMQRRPTDQESSIADRDFDVSSSATGDIIAGVPSHTAHAREGARQILQGDYSGLPLVPEEGSSVAGTMDVNRGSPYQNLQQQDSARNNLNNNKLPPIHQNQNSQMQQNTTSGSSYAMQQQLIQQQQLQAQQEQILQNQKAILENQLLQQRQIAGTLVKAAATLSPSGVTNADPIGMSQQQQVQQQPVSQLRQPMQLNNGSILTTNGTMSALDNSVANIYPMQMQQQQQQQQLPMGGLLSGSVSPAKSGTGLLSQQPAIIAPQLMPMAPNLAQAIQSGMLLQNQSTAPVHTMAMGAANMGINTNNVGPSNWADPDPSQGAMGQQKPIIVPQNNQGPVIQVQSQLQQPKLVQSNMFIGGGQGKQSSSSVAESVGAGAVNGAPTDPGNNNNNNSNLSITEVQPAIATQQSQNQIQNQLNSGNNSSAGGSATGAASGAPPGKTSVASAGAGGAQNQAAAGAEVDDADLENYYYAEDGHCYYYDPATGESSYVDPKDVPAKVSGVEGKRFYGSGIELEDWSGAEAGITAAGPGAMDSNAAQAEPERDAEGGYYDELGGYYDAAGNYYDTEGNFYAAERTEQAWS